jgi:hypothetical protein
MNALCDFCPIKYFCEDDDEWNAKVRAYELATKLSRANTRLLDHGLEAVTTDGCEVAASVLATGERHERRG